MKNKTPVNPNYYKGITPDGTEIEILDVVDAFNLNHNRACMLKYIAPADSKDNVVLDLFKCMKYNIRELKKYGVDVSYLDEALSKYDKPFTVPARDPSLDLNAQMEVNDKIDEYKDKENNPDD